MPKVRILETVFENGAPVHTKGEIKDLEGAGLSFLTNRGWARELTADERKEAATDAEPAADESADGEGGSKKKKKSA